MFLSQYEVLSSHSGMSALSTITVFIFAPLYGIVTGSHLLRDGRATVFEISLIKSRSGLILSKLIALTLGYLPILFIEAIIFGIFNKNFSTLAMSVTVLYYISFTMASSLIPDNKGAMISVTSFLFLIPFSMSAAVASMQSSGRSNLILSLLVYVFSPFYASTISTTLSIQLYVGFAISAILSLSLIVTVITLFNRVDLSP